MCIAIYQAPGVRLPKEQLVESWRNNPDGGGFAYFDSNGEIVIEKDMTLDGMLRKYERAVDRYAQYSPFAVHFRIATHGGVNIDNCHPFRVNDDTVMIHNGIIPVVFESSTDPRSDTKVFASDYLSKLPSNWMDDDNLFDMVETFVGASKLVVLTRAGLDDAYIVNEDSGGWSDDKDFWYSNGSYKAATKFYWGNKNQLSLGCDVDEAGLSDPSLPECFVCGFAAVYDGLCYQCESCAGCYQEEEHCLCGNKVGKIHGMTDKEYTDAKWYA